MLSAVLLLTLTACPVERGDVKVLSDAAAVRVAVDQVQLVTIEELVTSSPPPRWVPDLPRQKRELRVYEVQADLTGYKLETDGDFHVVLRSRAKGHRTMIVEFPDKACLAGSRVSSEASAARDAFLKLVPKAPGAWRVLKKPIPVSVVGVLFYDRLHGQKGLAPNGVELHPVISISGSGVGNAGTP